MLRLPRVAAPSNRHHSVRRGQLLLARAMSASQAHLEGVPAGQRVHEILSYWFGPDYAQPVAPGLWSPPEITAKWFKGGPEVDEYVTQHFGGDVEALASGACDAWLTASPFSGLAGVVLADQFTRNIYRGTARAFSLDPLAISWARQLQASGAAAALPAHQRYFLLMPFMHSEQLADQQHCVDSAAAELAAARAQDPGSAASKQWALVLQFAEAHRDVVAKWGRFPHRNALLGRPSTPEEEAGLADGSIGRW